MYTGVISSIAFLISKFVFVQFVRITSKYVQFQQNLGQIQLLKSERRKLFADGPDEEYSNSRKLFRTSYHRLAHGWNAWEDGKLFIFHQSERAMPQLGGMHNVN